MKLLSIITINLNNADGLLDTIASVAVQKDAVFEHIVIDGASTDDSVEIIKKYKSRFGYTISEKDTGIYQAMNKGIKAAKGDYLLFLNSGDTLKDDKVLHNLYQQVKNLDADIYHTDIMLIDKLKRQAFMHHYPHQVDLQHFLKSTISHQTACIRKVLFDKLGVYNENYEIASDWAFFLLAAKNGATFQHLHPLVLSNFLRHGLSSNQFRSTNENNEILQQEYPELVDLIPIKPKQSFLIRAWRKLLREVPGLYELNFAKMQRRKRSFNNYQRQMESNIKRLNEILTLNLTKQR